jgi:hypothetical protein
MTEQPSENKSTAGQAWEEVGQQFRQLGASLASAFKATWENEDTRQHVEEIQGGLEAIVDEISQATKKVAASEEAEKVKVEVKKAAQSAQVAGQEAIDEVRPELLVVFQRIRAELDQIINRMEPSEPDSDATSDSEQGE